MGIVLAEVRFNGSAPTPAAIAETVQRLAGLPTTVTDLLSSNDPRSNPRLYGLHAHLAFAQYPKHTVELTAYRPGAVAEHMAGLGMANMPVTPFVQGINEPPDTQTVYLQIYTGQEPTLFVTTLLALESLGGRPAQPLAPQALRDFAPPFTADQLARRHRRANRRGVAALALLILSLPITLPLLAISIIRHLLSLPDRIKQARESLKTS